MARAALGLFFCASLVLTPALGAQNLLTNPHFAGSTSPWVNGATSLTYDAAHSAAADGTGSAASVLQEPAMTTSANSNAISECVDGITVGQLYEFGGQIYIPPGQPAGGGYGQVLVQWYGSAGCAPPFVNNSDGPTVDTSTSATGVWLPSQSAAVAPPGTTSAKVIGEILTREASGQNFQVNYDDLYFQTATFNATIPTLRTSGLLVLALAVAAAGIALLRRRVHIAMSTRRAGR